MGKNNFERIDFSIVVCCYFGEKTIVRCLNSLIDQNYSNSDYEIIIVDDGSIDNSSNVISSFLNNIDGQKPLIKYFKTENNGLSKARNLGINKAGGKYVLFIDEDAAACNDWLLEYRKLIDSNDKPDVIYGITEPFNNSGYFEKYITHYFYHQVNANGDMIPYLIGTNMGFNYNLFKDDVGFLDDFSYRGDENALLLSLNFPYTEAGSIEAIVQHKNPHNIHGWLKERTQNGEALFMLDYFKYKLLSNRFKQKKLHYQSRLILYLSVVLAFLLFQLADSKLIIILFLSIFSIFYFKNSEVNKKFCQMKKQFSSMAYKVLFSYFCLKFLGILYQEYGYIKSILFNSKKYSLKSSFSREIIFEQSF